MLTKKYMFVFDFKNIKNFLKIFYLSFINYKSDFYNMTIISI